MATLLGRQELDARVEFRSFSFQESDESVVPVPFPDDFQWGVFLQAHVRRFDLFSVRVHGLPTGAAPATCDGSQCPARGRQRHVGREQMVRWPLPAAAIPPPGRVGPGVAARGEGGAPGGQSALLRPIGAPLAGWPGSPALPRSPARKATP